MKIDAAPIGHQQKIQLGMLSGKQLIVSHVMLFPEPELQEALLLKAKAHEELGGFTTGIGFWGSPEWVIGGAALLGFVDSIISNAKTKRGLDLLAEAATKFEQLKTKGVFVDVSAIDGIGRPNPADWRAIHASKFQIDLNPMGMMEQSQYIQKYNISRNLIVNGVASVVSDSVGHVHNGDDFIWVEVDSQQTAIRWSSVEYYQLV